MFTLTLDDFKETRARIAPHIKHTPLLRAGLATGLGRVDDRLFAAGLVGRTGD